MAIHGALPVDQIHIPYNWEYADAAARAADTSVTVDDVGKFARQLDDDSIWMLLTDTPTWIAIGGGGSSFSGARVRRTTNQTIPDSTGTPITFDTETYDEGGYWAGGAPTRFTVPETGYYRVHGRVSWAVPGSDCLVQVTIQHNGATDVARAQADALATGNNVVLETSVDFPATATQYFRLLVFQDSGGNLDANQVDNWSIVFEIQKIG